jgi:multidrug efflux pump subunit AcrB
VILLVFSVYGYRFIKQGFFPDLSYNQLYIEYKMPFGTNPETVEKDLASMEKYLMSRPEITAVTTSLGGTPSRYNLVRTVAEPALSYGELIVDFTSPAALKEHLNELQAYLSSHYPQAYVRMKQYNLMYMDFPIQFMISGPDPAVLKSLCAQVEGIMRADSSVMLVTNNWGPETPAMRVDYQQQTARDVNLSREDVGLAVLAATDGLPIGSYYEGEHPLPIYLKSVNDQGQRPGQIGNVPVWSMVPSTNGIGLGTVKELMTGMIGTDDVLKRLIGSVPLNQASSGVEVGWEVPVVRRYNGQRSIAVQCNNAPGYTTTAARNSLLPKIEALDIPPGYTTAWQGEYLASTQSQFYLFKNVPIAIVLILAILIALFKDFRKPLMILLCLPLAITGVVAGMLIAGKEFGFVAIVGALGLVGMMIKNGVVLVDEVDIQIRSGKDPFLALVDASTSRLRPVFLAAMTTILGMIPLVNDDMFGALAVTIMGGLFIGTIITLVILPILYSLFFRIRPAKHGEEEQQQQQQIRINWR